MGETMRKADWRAVVSRVVGVLVLLAGILLAAGLCVANTPTDHPVPSIFEPHSTPAESIRHLSHFVLGITGLIFLVVFGLLSYAIVKLLAADTYHSFWIPQLAGKTDLIPNRVNETWLDPQETGLFLGQCAQYCGTQHAKMLLRVYVDSTEDFNAWVRGQQQPANYDEKEAAGRRAFESTACLNCHAIAGTNGTGRFGPDLTHLMSRRTIAAGAAENTPENLRLWIQNPDAIKTGSLMPALKLSDTELDALVRYLETLR